MDIVLNIYVIHKKFMKICVELNEFLLYMYTNYEISDVMFILKIL